MPGLGQGELLPLALVDIEHETGKLVRKAVGGQLHVAGEVDPAMFAGGQNDARLERLEGEHLHPLADDPGDALPVFRRDDRPVVAGGLVECQGAADDLDELV